jgi:flagellar protein FliO/FliZ
MTDPKQRKKVMWALVLGGALLLSLLFITTLAPSTPRTSDPVIHVGGDGATTLAAAPAASSGSGFSLGGGQVVSLAWRLGLVAVIIAVSIVGLRWWGKKTAGPRSTTGFIKVVDTLAISNGRTIHLVALGDRVIAVGATAQQLSLLNELTEDEAAKLLAAVPQPSDQPLVAFAAELFQSMRRGGATTRRPGSQDRPATAISDER